MKAVEDKQAKNKIAGKISEIMGRIHVQVMNNQNKMKRSLYGGKVLI